MAILNMNIYATMRSCVSTSATCPSASGEPHAAARGAGAAHQEGLVRIVARRGIFIVRKTKAEILDMITDVGGAREHGRPPGHPACRGRRDGAAARPRPINSRKTRSARKMGEYSEANIKFHQAIIGLSKCPLIVEITNGLFFICAPSQRTIFEQDRARRSIVDHKEIVAALEARDTDRAERLVREHTLRLRDHVERFVELD